MAEAALSAGWRRGRRVRDAEMGSARPEVAPGCRAHGCSSDGAFCFRPEQSRLSLGGWVYLAATERRTQELACGF